MNLQEIEQKIVQEFDMKFNHINYSEPARRICNNDCSEDYSLQDINLSIRSALQKQREAIVEKIREIDVDGGGSGRRLQAQLLEFIGNEE